jgi:hypothetical protein
MHLHSAPRKAGCRIWPGRPNARKLVLGQVPGKDLDDLQRSAFMVSGCHPSEGKHASCRAERARVAGCELSHIATTDCEPQSVFVQRRKSELMALDQRRDMAQFS